MKTTVFSEQGNLQDIPSSPFRCTHRRMQRRWDRTSPSPLNLQALNQHQQVPARTLWSFRHHVLFCLVLLLFRDLVSLRSAMQVSFACTDHGLKAPRNNEPTKQNTASPNTTSAARARFRTVALIARSLGSFTHRHHISLKESTGKLTGMKYRYGTCSFHKSAPPMPNVI